ncbi:MAG: nuclear transport factor 2 family protein, partial [Pseudomonadota bacterium]
TYTLSTPIVSTCQTFLEFRIKAAKLFSALEAIQFNYCLVESFASGKFPVLVSLQHCSDLSGDQAQSQGDINMLTATEVVQQAYAAFGRGDVPAILELVANDIDWELVGPKKLAYAGHRSNRNEVGAFFESVAQSDNIHVFEPREFIAAGEHVTVLGWEESTAIETNTKFASEWVHVFTVKNGRVTRWRGFFDTAARYGIF